MVASTWLGNHQGRPSAPTNSLHKLHMARYQVHQLQLQLIHILFPFIGGPTLETEHKLMINELWFLKVVSDELETGARQLALACSTSNFQ